MHVHVFRSVCLRCTTLSRAIISVDSRTGTVNNRVLSSTETSFCPFIISANQPHRSNTALSSTGRIQLLQQADNCNFETEAHSCLITERITVLQLSASFSYRVTAAMCIYMVCNLSVLNSKFNYWQFKVRDCSYAAHWAMGSVCSNDCRTFDWYRVFRNAMNRSTLR